MASGRHLRKFSKIFFYKTWERARCQNLKFLYIVCLQAMRMILFCFFLNLLQISGEKLLILNKFNNTNDPVLFDWRNKVDKHEFVKNFKNPTNLQVENEIWRLFPVLNNIFKLLFFKNILTLLRFPNGAVQHYLRIQCIFLVDFRMTERRS